MIVFQRLEEDVLTFVKEQLQRLHRLLLSEDPESSSESEEEQSSREAVLNITLDLLRRMKQEQLAERLSSSKNSVYSPEEQHTPGSELFHFRINSVISAQALDTRHMVF